MPTISKKIRNALVQDLTRNHQSAFLGENGDSLIEFLMLTWDLRMMPSTDERFKDAQGDIYQHIINNNDWDYDYLFFERLDVLNLDDGHFAKFLEAIVNPSIRKTNDSIDRFAFLINSYVEKEGCILNIDSYNDLDVPIYRLQTKDHTTDVYRDFRKNNIPFIVQKKVLGKSNRFSSHTKPSKLPSFVLAFNSGWNDYGKMTSFDLFYYDEEGKGINIGPLKIIYAHHDAILDNEDSILQLLPKTFEVLDQTFSSLGQTEKYYLTLRELFKKNLFSVLFALQDVAFFPELSESFQANPLMRSSLMRYEAQERLSRIAKPLVFGYDLNTLFNFKYYFKPSFSDDAIPVDFDFSSHKEISNRIYALIGKNGTGKTQLITSLPLKIASKEDSFFSPKTPLFSKVIAVSYSVFDKFEIPRKTSTFNYLYCGLRNEENEISSVRSQTLKFHNTWKKIKTLDRIEKWRNILLLFIEESIVDEMIFLEKPGKYQVNLQGVNSAKSKLSSGQNIILNIVSEVVANIMYDSLLLYDEPETHLHPNAITELINTIYQLVNEFQSYCIIATHSPLIIRELFSKNVYVLDKVDSTLSIRRIGIESFGENITTLTEEVFGNRETSKQYKTIIQKLIGEGKSFDQIVELLQSDQAPLSLNTRIYIKSLVNENA